jgi:hypothetical protein
MTWTITFSRFWPAIGGMEIISLVFSKYSSTSPTFLIQLLLLDYPDVPQVISNISTMCTRCVRQVMQLDTWMNSEWRLSFISIRGPHWPHFLWHVWHHSLKFCYHISSLTLLLLCCLTVTCTRKLNVWAVLQCNLDFRMFTWCVRPLHMHRQIIISHNLVTEIKK